MNELERFSKKALFYRMALERSPKARLLEIYPILQLLHLHASTTSRSISSLKILDLMSGSGFLAECLHKVGFHNLHAVEFCDAMCNDAPIYAEKVRLHRVRDFAHLEAYLEHISPDVIVSLASFHHLLRYQDSIVDLSSSRMLQKSVIDICMRSLSPSGLLIITDLIEETVPETAFPKSGYALRAALTDLASLGVPHIILEPLRKCRSIQSASSTVAREYISNVGNISLDWFRNYVDNKTSIGHKDAAISVELVELLSNYKPSITKYWCPWMFDSVDERNNFINLKFGFALDSNTPKHIAIDRIGTDAETLLGIKNIHGKTFLGWNLGIIALWRNSPFESERRYMRLVSSLSAIIFLLIVGLLLRSIVGVYATPSWSALLIFAITLPIGVIFGELLHSFSSNQK